MHRPSVQTIEPLGRLYVMNRAQFEPKNEEISLWIIYEKLQIVILIRNLKCRIYYYKKYWFSYDIFEEKLVTFIEAKPRKEMNQVFFNMN